MTMILSHSVSQSIFKWSSYGEYLTFIQNHVEAIRLELVLWNFAWTNGRLYAFWQILPEFSKIYTLDAIRPGISMEKISILRVMKKKWTHHKFLHVGPKKHVEQESDTYFGLSWAKKKRNGFLCQKQLFFLKKWYQMKYFWVFFYRNIKYQ